MSNRADFLNAQRLADIRHNELHDKLDRIIDLLAKIAGDES